MLLRVKDTGERGMFEQTIINWNSGLDDWGDGCDLGESQDFYYWNYDSIYGYAVVGILIIQNEGSLYGSHDVDYRNYGFCDDLWWNADIRAALCV